MAIVTLHDELEQKRATPGPLPKAPWTQPQNPDIFTMLPPAQTNPSSSKTLDTYITKSHYNRATNRAPSGKAPGPDAITNELIKHLPEEGHTFIYTIFQLMAKHNCTPREWCKSATCLLYKPNKTDPHNIAYYRPIALMNGILKLWTSILTNINSP